MSITKYCVVTDLRTIISQEWTVFYIMIYIIRNIMKYREKIFSPS